MHYIHYTSTKYENCQEHVQVKFRFSKKAAQIWKISQTQTVILLKYQFCKNVTSEKWNSGGLNTFRHICLHFWAWLLLYSVITPKSEDKYVQKCSTRQSFIFPKRHSYKIGTLAHFSEIVRVVGLSRKVSFRRPWLSATEVNRTLRNEKMNGQIEKA